MINILIVEDDGDDFLLLEEALGDVLHQPQIAHSRDGKDLLQKIDDQAKPDIIFLDLNIPKVNGIDCLKSIRKQDRLNATPVIIYSTSSDVEDIDICYQSGCTLYLIKQTSFKELVKQLKKIFAHERSEEALRKSEEQFRLFVSAASTHAYKMSADWKEMYLLTGKEFLTGTEQIPNNWLELNVLTEEQPKVLDAIQEAIRTKTVFELEHKVVKADGTIGWMFSRVIPVLNADGEILEWFGLATDITDKKNAEENLKEEHIFLEQITNSTPHLIYVFDLDEEYFIYVNKRIEELTGIHTEYIYGMGPHIFKKILHPEDLMSRMSYMNNLRNLLPGEIVSNEFRIKVGAEYRWFRSKDYIFKSENGKVSQVIGLGEDITYEYNDRDKTSSSSKDIGLN
jgi:PAS domain S-box-containing protein